MKKTQIRKKILKKRKYFTDKDIKINFSKLIKLLNLEISSKKIGIYYPVGSEASTIRLIESLRKKNILFYCRSSKKTFKCHSTNGMKMAH